MTARSTFATYAWAHRQRAGLSLTALAGELDMEPDEVSAVERGLTAPPEGKLMTWADAIGANRLTFVRFGHAAIDEQVDA